MKTIIFLFFSGCFARCSSTIHSIFLILELIIRYHKVFPLRSNKVTIPHTSTLCHSFMKFLEGKRRSKSNQTIHRRTLIKILKKKFFRRKIILMLGLMFLKNIQITDNKTSWSSTSPKQWNIDGGKVINSTKSRQRKNILFDHSDFLKKLNKIKQTGTRFINSDISETKWQKINTSKKSSDSTNFNFSYMLLFNRILFIFLHKYIVSYLKTYCVKSFSAYSRNVPPNYLHFQTNTQKREWCITTL